MKENKKIGSKIIKRITNNALTFDANETACIWLYQPKAPAALKKFSKIEDDK